MARPRTRPLPEIAELRERFAYDPHSGNFYHNLRTGEDRISKAWNTRYAGTIAGCAMNEGYWSLKVGKQSLLAHRVAWAIVHGVWPDELDHRDGDKRNNRLSNLRLASRTQNSANRPGRALSGLKGVRKSRSGRRWNAYINVGNRMLYLGSFEAPEIAHAAYKGAAKVLHGDFANTEVIRVGSIAATISFAA